MKKIYIAGFDVFEPDSIEIGKKFVKLCEEYGFIGLYPLDNVIDFNQEKNKIAQDIYKANLNLINQCDIVIANINAFIAIAKGPCFFLYIATAKIIKSRIIHHSDV